MATGDRPPDPVIVPRFKVAFGSKLTGGFTEVSTASMELTPVPYQSTGTDGQPNWTTQPGTRKNPTITLKRGMTSDLSAWSWHKEAADGQIASARVNGSISILNADGSPAATFDVINAWPTKVDMPALQASGTTPGIEVITLTCEGFSRSA
jgi:phage tail-like protein